MELIIWAYMQCTPDVEAEAIQKVNQEELYNLFDKTDWEEALND